jgi:hypothetical protein
MKDTEQMARKGATYCCPACGQKVKVLVASYIPVCVKHYKRYRMEEQS